MVAAADGRAVTFVTAIEYGVLEDMVTRLAESLRRWGGALAEAPFICVRPRRGPSLTPGTRRILRRYDVQCLDAPEANPHPYYDFLNKIAAAGLAEQQATTPQLAWLDADTLVLRDLAGLALDDQHDFAGYIDRNLAVTDSNSGTAGYHDAIARTLGLTLEQVPWVSPAADPPRLRLNYQGGVLVWRKKLGFPAAWMRAVCRLQEQKIGEKSSGFFLNEQSVIGTLATAMGARWTLLPQKFNAPLSGYMLREGATSHLAEACILHYHEAMLPPSFPMLLAALREAAPWAHEMLEKRGPARRPVSPHRLLVQKTFQRARLRKFQRCEAAITRY